MPTTLTILLLIFNLTCLFSQAVDRRLALVIGNGNYQNSTLANPENDAKAMKSVLQKVGFDVLEYENLNQSQMKKATDEFGLRLKNYDVALFYYAGHGMQVRGYNYLIPVDAVLNYVEQVEYDCMQVDRVLAIMEGAGTKVNIIILDACRNNPFERSWTRSESGKGLAFMNAPVGTLIGYATSPGSTAADGSGNNGLYTSALLESIMIPDFTISQMFQNVARIVIEKTSKKQVPWIASSLTADFYFGKNDKITSPQTGFGKDNKLPYAEVKEPKDTTQSKINPLRDNATPIIEGKYYALMIGIDNYKDTLINDLDNSIKNSELFYNTITSNYTFEKENVKFLKDATFDEIIEALDYFAKIVQPVDNFLIFYAGHGVYNSTNDIGYWLPSDAQSNTKRAWFRNSTLRDFLNEIRAKHTLLISDACFPGYLFVSQNNSSDKPLSIGDLYNFTSKKAMISGVLNEVPDQSAFIMYLVNKLVQNPDKYLSSEQLYNRFRIAVINNSSVVPQYGPIKGLGDEGGDFIFVHR